MKFLFIKIQSQIAIYSNTIHSDIMHNTALSSILINQKGLATVLLHQLLDDSIIMHNLSIAYNCIWPDSLCKHLRYGW